MALPPPAPGSTCVITGASAGIGEQFANQLAGRGYNVLLVARRRERIRDLAAELERDHGVRADFVACDLADPLALPTVPDAVVRRALEVDVLVNNAGFGT